MITKRIDASILLYSLFVMVIITIIIGSVILLSYFNHVERKSYQIENELRSNVNSGMALMLGDSEVVKYGETVSISLFEKEDASDLITIRKELWGLFDQYYCEANWGRFKKEKIVFAGNYYKNDESIALYLTDKKNPLCLVGKTLINGNCKIPKAGIKRGYVEGRNFEGKEFTLGKTIDSDTLLPINMDKIQPNDLNNVLRKMVSNYNLDVVNYSDINTNSMLNSFYDPTIIVYGSESFSIDKSFSGNIMIVSEQDILIERGCELQDVLIYAKNIFIESGFKGSLQCFAHDTLAVANDCQFKFPSTLSTINLSKKENLSQLKIESGTTIEGTVLQYSMIDKKFSMPEIIISKNASITGQIYATGSLELIGNVYGSVFTNAFVLSKPSARYINHLSDIEINLGKLPEWFVGTLLFDDENPAKIMKEL